MERKDTTKINKTGNTLFIAHRGLSGLEKENTLAAFIAAGNRKAYYGIETDVHFTKDGYAVLMHDTDMERVSGEKLNIEQSTFETVRRIYLTDCDGKTKRPDLVIPTLAEYVQTCKKYGKIGVLELKSDFSVQQIKKLISEINREKYIDGIIFISFFLNNCRKIRKLLPSQTVQFLTTDASDKIISELASYGIDFDICHTSLTEERIEKMHSAGLKVNCWTVDNSSDAEKLIKWNVDFITTDILEPCTE